MGDWERFGERIQRRREALKLPMDAIAATAEVSYQTVSKWEKSQTRPQREKLAALASALELDEETLVGWWAGLGPSPDADRGPVQARYERARPETQRAIDLLLDASEARSGQKE